VHQISTLKSTDVLAVKHVRGTRLTPNPVGNQYGYAAYSGRVHPRGVVFQKQLFHLLTVLVLRNRPCRLGIHIQGRAKMCVSSPHCSWSGECLQQTAALKVNWIIHHNTPDKPAVTVVRQQMNCTIFIQKSVLCFQQKPGEKIKCVSQ